MLVAKFTQLDLYFIEDYRIALSEPDVEQRIRAIENVRHDVVATLIEEHFPASGSPKKFEKRKEDVLEWIARSEPRRRHAAIEQADLNRKYEKEYEKKLNVAEYVGELIFSEIKNGTFRGVQSDTGILQQVSHRARKLEIRGARDHDTLRKIWKTYRGVVHLGMAINYHEENPDQSFGVLRLTETFRQSLSKNYPRSHSAPYVDPVEQVKFCLKSIF